ncbi:FadR/GntR family transcriptional regulator [Mycobacterium shigaense]|uniref:Putative transcriptional regulator, GntR n=1 Tax=Mycobacterium shigaense TaxID=722731 RepID=A0A1Z4EGU1_9MYCO|nr:FadR/GntR family transcriptional regulator [Mycobacterium shigaense]MEA1122900.1 FadR/GntR family transcriptional regulator [Mycobacterium shigaense]PRI13299.1 GntR family transcriptional regulator [Mycobacterium shigaense]BAX92194.1 putative transcriptional regulator, GntR [Mycobacterium shigaense]
MQTVRRQTLVAQVSDQLRDEITSGRWQVGERIATEPELCKMTGASRHTVREAVQALVHAGMLERRQGSGTYVLSNDEHCGALAEYFAAARERDVLELREALEVTATALAAQRRDATDIAELRAVLVRRNELWRKDPDTESERAELVSADMALHRAIVAASHNEIYLQFYDLLVPTLCRSVETRPVGSVDSHEAQHTELVDAIVAGDPKRAEAAARVFISILRG